MNIKRQDIARGYEPVAKLDTNIMASRKALSKMGFPVMEIDKIDAVAKIRKRFVEISRKLVKMSKKGKYTLEQVMATPLAPISCDICGSSMGLGIANLTSPEQAEKIPPDWTLLHIGSPMQNNEKDIVVIPPGVVIDYQGGKVYTVCGTCQLVLGLKATEAGILIHEIRNDYGFIDLDRVEQLIQKYQI
jgi:hypothetical protein